MFFFLSAVITIGVIAVAAYLFRQRKSHGRRFGLCGGHFLELLNRFLNIVISPAGEPRDAHTDSGRAVNIKHQDTMLDTGANCSPPASDFEDLREPKAEGIERRADCERNETAVERVDTVSSRASDMSYEFVQAGQYPVDADGNPCQPCSGDGVSEPVRQGGESSAGNLVSSTWSRVRHSIGRASMAKQTDAKEHDAGVKRKSTDSQSVTQARAPNAPLDESRGAASYDESHGLVVPPQVKTPLEDAVDRIEAASESSAPAASQSEEGDCSSSDGGDDQIDRPVTVGNTENQASWIEGTTGNRVTSTVEAEKSKTAGNDAFKAGDWEAAYRHYTDAVDACPPDELDAAAIYLSNRAAVHLMMNRAQEAKDDATEAIELKPQYAKAYLRRYKANIILEKWHDVIADLNKAIELDPSLEETYRFDKIKYEAKSKEVFEKEKEEMMGKLKEFGSWALGKVGLSLDNFQVEQNDSGSYNIQFKQNPPPPR